MPIGTGGGTTVGTGVVVLASHLPGAPHYTSDNYTVRPVVCDGDFDYWRGLLEVWESADTIINLEHDMDCSDTLIAELLECQEPVCSFAYTLHWATTRDEDHYAQRDSAGMWVTEGTEWCAFTGIGLCKIRPEVRGPLVAHGGDPESHWQHVDMAVGNALTCRVHVHWPAVEHDHY